MQPKFVTGTEYMDALARLGYNVENMSSPLPIMAKIADAGASMLDNVYKQNLNYQEAQGRLSYYKAQSDHLDEETQYNQRTQDARVKTLDYEAALKKNQADLSNATIEQQIEAEKNRLKLLPQIQQNEADKAKNDAQRSKLELDGQANAQRIQKEGLDDLPLALGELPNPGDPDYYPKIQAARDHHGAAMLDPVSRARFEGEVKARTDQHVLMASTQAQNKDQQELLRLHDGHFIDDATAQTFNQIQNDPVARQRVIARGHVVEANTGVNEVLGMFPRDPAEFAKLPPLVQQQYNDLAQMERQMSGVLGTDEGLDQVVGGSYLKVFDRNGNLTPQLKSDMQALRDYHTERTKALAEKGVGTTKLKATLPDKTDVTGKRNLMEIERDIPNEDYDQTVQQLRAQGWNVPEPASGQTTQTKTSAARTQTGSTNLQTMAATNPQLKALLSKAVRSGTAEDWDRLEQAYNALRSVGQDQAMVPGFQEGGTVTQTGTGDTPASTDTVPAMLTPGEYVVNADAARENRSVLDRINQTGAQTPIPPMRPLAGSSLPTLPMPSTTPQRQQAQQPVDVSRGYAREQTPAPRALPVSATPSQTPAVTTGPATIPGVAKTTGGLPPQVGSNIGGVQITHYGYIGDSSWDRASGMGKGDRENQLTPLVSVALTVPMRQHLFGTSGASTGKTFQWGGQTYRDDDTAPESGYRIDVYNPSYGGLDKGVTPEMVDLRRRQLGFATETYQTGGLVTDPTMALDTSQGAQDISTLALLASQSAGAQSAANAMPGFQHGGEVKDDLPKGVFKGPLESEPVSMPSGGMMGGIPGAVIGEGVLHAPPLDERFEPQRRQHGGFVTGGELGGGMGGDLGGRGGGGELGARGTGGELGDPIQQQTRHRRFRPRMPGQQQRPMGPTIPDEMQRKLAKLSQDYLSGLSGLIRSRPEIGPQLLRHARNQLAANIGAPGEEEQMQQQQPTMPSEGQQFSPAQYAMTAQMGEET